MVALARQPWPNIIVAAVDVELFGNRAVDQHEHGRAAGAGGRPVITVFRIGQRPDRRGDHRHVFRFAAGHHGIDRHLLRGHRDLTVLDEGQLLVGLETAGIQHRGDTFRSRRNHRQAVGPAVGVTKLDGTAQIVDGVSA